MSDIKSLSSQDEIVLANLRKNGVEYLPHFVPRAAMDEVDEYLSTCWVYNAHVRAKSTESIIQNEAVRKNRWPMFCVDMQDAVVAPHLFELMVDHYDFAKRYFDGEQPILYSMNCFWTQPAPGAPQYLDTHGWHRDLDDRKQLVIFVFGTDVIYPQDGGHQYQVGTQNVSDQSLGRDFRAPPPHGVKTITGKKGTAFVSDTRGLHVGFRPNKLRMLAWGRWGVSTPPQSYAWDKLKPVNKSLLGDRYPSSPDVQDAIRFVVQ